MKTHLYTLCWNEADMLEFFFRNYDSWVDRYIVYDDGSTDGSIEILKSHPKVELRQWHRKYSDSYVMSQMDWMSHIWKESRGCADWAVIVDVDEHLFTPKCPMLDLLERYKTQGITLVPALGFQILSEDFPEADEHLVQTRTWGRPWRWMCKLSIINPDAIEETNFSLGRHTANAVGRVKIPRRDELLLFHYKYLGFERTFEKESAQSANLGTFDRVTGLLQSYRHPRQNLREKWDKHLKRSEDISWPNYNLDRYPFIYRWWRLMKYYFVSRWFRRAKRFIREPSYMIKRLKQFIANKENRQHRHPWGLFMEELYRSPIKKEIYLLTIDGGTNGKEGDTVVVSNGKDEKGTLFQCLHSPHFDTLQDHLGIQKAIAAKHKNEKKYKKAFDAFVITNSKGFQKNAVNFAKINNVKLVSHNDLISFIHQAKVPSSE